MIQDGLPVSVKIVTKDEDGNLVNTQDINQKYIGQNFYSEVTNENDKTFIILKNE